MHHDESVSIKTQQRQLNHQQPQHNDTVRGLPFPYCRYGRKWEDLHHSTARSLRTHLGYTRIGWNAAHDLENSQYNDIDEESKKWIRSHVLCSNDDEQNQKVWDCFVNHYYNYWWSDIQDAGLTQYFEVLGWTRDVWDGGNYNSYPASEFSSFEELDEAEQLAARQLCWFKDKWNGLSMEQWDPLPQPPQNSSISYDHDEHHPPTASPTDELDRPDSGPIIAEIDRKVDTDDRQGGMDERTIFLLVGGVCGTLLSAMLMFLTFYDWPKDASINPSISRARRTQRENFSPTNTSRQTSRRPAQPEMNQPANREASQEELAQTMTSDIERPTGGATEPDSILAPEEMYGEETSRVIDCDEPINYLDEEGGEDPCDSVGRDTENNSTGAAQLNKVVSNPSVESGTTDTTPSSEDLDDLASLGTGDAEVVSEVIVEEETAEDPREG